LLFRVSVFRAIRRSFAGDWILAIFLQFVSGAVLLSYYFLIRLTRKIRHCHHAAALSFATSVLMVLTHSLSLLSSHLTISFQQPFIMLWLNAKTDPSAPPELAKDWLGYLYLIDIVLSNVMASLSSYHSHRIGWRLGVKIRAALNLVSYRKALSLGATKTRNTGNVVNLVATDAQLISETLPFFNQGFMAPLQIVGTLDPFQKVQILFRKFWPNLPCSCDRFNVERNRTL